MIYNKLYIQYTKCVVVKGVPLSYKLFPEYLKLSGLNYVTAMVGKWDIGHYNQKLWPVERGFDR